MKFTFFPMVDLVQDIGCYPVNESLILTVFSLHVQHHESNVYPNIAVEFVLDLDLCSILIRKCTFLE